ncbi:Lar family restriction alleviation protein [Mesorhizobium sp.]|uniref:Lar family restriction alleviation protein n=1 Tax=Mesorhizobium sp. TaxID=1871066 RepID=UPI00257B31A4|nr:Lar family restriction alleviation protein [Mesorhizobium sp.]
MTDQTSAPSEGSADLKPCPFCGGKAAITDQEPFCVECCEERCNVNGPCHADKADAIVAWNRRDALASQPVPAGAVMGLEWRDDGDGVWVADTDVGYYAVRCPDLWIVSRDGNRLVGCPYELCSFAKAAAQADYEARIRSALAPTRSQEMGQVAWLIERNDNPSLMKPVWFAENSIGIHRWTPIASLATRFTSKAGAEAHPDYKLIANDPTISITRHVSLDTLIAPAIQAVPDTVRPVCRVMTMQHSSGAPDHYVSIEVGDRQITPHMFKTKGRAEYEVAEWIWLLNGGEKPHILDFDTDPQPLTNQVSLPASDKSQSPAGAKIRSTQGKAMEAAPVTGQSPVGAVSPCGLADPSYHDCPNMKEIGGGMDGERYRCGVCGKWYFLDYEDMK